jgi:hypothetical protein
MKTHNERLLRCCILSLIAITFSGCGTDPLAQPVAKEDAESQVTASDSSGGTATTPPDGVAENAKPTKPVARMSDEAFRMAAYEGRIESVRKGIEAGSDVNAADPVKSLTPLHMAAYNGHSDVVTLLLEHDAEVDCRDDEGKTPLIHACTGPFAKAVEVLLDAGAELNAKESTESFTPLMMAAGLGQTEVVELLLSRNADKSILDEDKDMAIDHARNEGHAAIVKLLE